jgi:flagellar hook-length control protein FliK
MHPTTVPIQRAAAAVPQRASVSGNADNTEFRAALAREIEQRHALVPPPPKPVAVPAPADQDARAEPAPPATPAAPTEPPAKQAGSGDSAAAGESSQDDDAPAEHPAAALTDMLALVASLQRVTPQPDGGAAVAADGPAGARAGAGQLAALQGAFKGLARGGADAAAGKARAALDPLQQSAAAEAAAARGPALGADSARQASGPRAGGDLFAAQLDAAPLRASLAQAAALNEPASAATPLAPAPASAFAVAQAAVAVPDRIAARVGSSAWDQQLGQKIVWMVGSAEHSATLTLNPPDLGPLQVVLSVSNDQASVAFSANQLEVRQALENALPRLREMMGENGIALGNATVDAGMPDGRQAQGGEQPREGGTAARFDNRTAVADSAPRTSARATTLGDRGMVDTFA